MKKYLRCWKGSIAAIISVTGSSLFDDDGISCESSCQSNSYPSTPFVGNPIQEHHFHSFSLDMHFSFKLLLWPSFKKLSSF